MQEYFDIHKEIPPAKLGEIIKTLYSYPHLYIICIYFYTNYAT